MVEVSAKHRGEERSEDDLGTVERRQGQPQEEDELEDEVEGEPVDDVDEALQDGKESKDNPVRQPLGVVSSARSEQGVQRVVAGNDKASKVGEQLAAEVEDDEEEVESGEADDGVGLGNTGLLLKVVQGGVLGELLVERSKVVLRLLLCGRHCGRWATT